MDDLVSRLRSVASTSYPCVGEAADRIEKLETALERITWACPRINVANSKHNQAVQKEIEQIARATLSGNRGVTK